MNEVFDVGPAEQRYVYLTDKEPLTKPEVAHYRGNIQPIDFIRESMSEESFRGFLVGNIIKYVSRHMRKNGVEDLKKAKIYLDWLIEDETHD